MSDDGVNTKNNIAVVETSCESDTKPEGGRQFDDVAGVNMMIRVMYNLNKQTRLKFNAMTAAMQKEHEDKIVVLRQQVDALVARITQDAERTMHECNKTFDTKTAAMRQELNNVKMEAELAKQEAAHVNKLARRAVYWRNALGFGAVAGAFIAGILGFSQKVACAASDLFGTGAVAFFPFVVGSFVCICAICLQKVHSTSRTLKTGECDGQCDSMLASEKQQAPTVTSPLERR
jgi:hypothetical protein